MEDKTTKHILWLNEINKNDTALVGGKNASLGEMFSNLQEKGIKVPNGFCLTSSAYRHFLKYNGIDKKLAEVFKKFNPKSLASLQTTGKQARNLILQAEIPPDLQKEILDNYEKLSQEYKTENLVVAVRSSATAEDLKGASFAGAMETYLNIRGGRNLLSAIKKCVSSLFTGRAIAYREEKGFEHLKIALSVGIIKMVRSDLGSSGVMFTLDTESGFKDVVLVNSIYGVGEMIVKGKITPDEFYVSKPLLEQGFEPIIVKNLGRKDKKYVFNKTGGLKEVVVPKNKQLKFSLADGDILQLARWAVIIEKHYGWPQDIEWARDGSNNELFIVQSRPETVRSVEKQNVYKEYVLRTVKQPVLTGIAVGNKIGWGRARVITDVSRLNRFKKGEVLVAKMTDPDWVPIMRLAGAIITDEGGKTAHAAIVSRELGVPCIVGTGRASRVLKTGEEITVDCSQGFVGRVFAGKVRFETKEYDLQNKVELPVKLAVNIGEPALAFTHSFLPVEGVGLAREEFIISEKIKAHPLALYHYDKLKTETKNKEIVKKIQEITVEHKDKREYFVKELAEGIGQIASAFWPRPVIVRFSDFKTNEYRNLIGGGLFEPQEENPMLGWRGASRYYDEKYKPAFLMECEAIKRARNVFGLKNIKLLVPFCRTPEEGEKVLAVMREAGLEKGKDGLEVYVMAEIPSNARLCEEFLQVFDGMSIGSNDLTQLVLGIDRDNGSLGHIGDESHEAVKRMIAKIIRICRDKGKYCGICGDAPSTLPGFAEFLIACGIESMSLSPDAVMKTILSLSKKQK
ncbi:MAG: phosphoenolpyruvate synthase [Patescibacteria group bacterium]|nr:phosphoenolpyruvate synthase [Patescibacteria group bacterium]